MKTLCCGFQAAPGLAQLQLPVAPAAAAAARKHTVSQTSSSSSAARHAAHHHQKQQPHRLLLVPAQAAAVDTQVEEDFTSPDNFYGILGIPQNASQRDIKRAYKAMMKDFHPDLSGDEESTEFCILLNDIYEVSVSAGWRCEGGTSLATAHCMRCDTVQPPVHTSVLQPHDYRACSSSSCEHVVVLSARRP